MINWEKSQLVPSQSASVLGFIINAKDETICLDSVKCSALQKTFSVALQSSKVKIKLFARWIGLCISILPCFLQGKLHYRRLEQSKLAALCARGFKWGKTMTVSHRDKMTLTWWLNIVNNNKPHMFRIPPISLTMSSDASLSGWGVCFDSGDRTGFRFSQNDMSYPINTKELLAIFYGLKTFWEKITGQHVLIKSDSMTALADMRKMGSMCSLFCDRLVRKIYSLLYSVDARVSLTFVPGVDNILADEKSRVFTSETSEWSLPPDIFRTLLDIAPEMEVDLFASHLNNKLPLFCSWVPTPGCMPVDAFTFDCNAKVCFCFPPCSMYLKCLDYIQTTRVKKLFMVIPWHPTAVWFPVMLKMMVQNPVFLPSHTGRSLFLPFPSKLKHHPLHRNLKLAFVHLSAN